MDIEGLRHRAREIGLYGDGEPPANSAEDRPSDRSLSIESLRELGRANGLYGAGEWESLRETINQQEAKAKAEAEAKAKALEDRKAKQYERLHNRRERLRDRGGEVRRVARGGGRGPSGCER